jgi:hypothetical protein
MTDPRQSALDSLTNRFVELGGSGQRSLFLRCLASELGWCFSVGVTRIQMWQGLQAHGYLGSYAQFARAFRTVLAGKEPQPPAPSSPHFPKTLQPDDEVLAQQIRLQRAQQKAEAMRAASVPPPKKFEYNP